MNPIDPAARPLDVMGRLNPFLAKLRGPGIAQPPFTDPEARRIMNALEDDPNLQLDMPTLATVIDTLIGRPVGVAVARDGWRTLLTALAMDDLAARIPTETEECLK